MAKEAVMYTQLQPWSAILADPCMEQVGGAPIPSRIGAYYSTSKRHPWRPTLGYETLQPMPLTNQPITNQIIDPCYTPYGMALEPLKVPNLITGFDRNPAHAARAALYTRYTLQEWKDRTRNHYNESEEMANYSAALRSNFNPGELRENDLKNQAETGRNIGVRITDLTFWRNEARKELENLMGANNTLWEAKNNLEKAIIDIEGPLQIAQECLYQREKRQGINLCHDIVEVCLLKEINFYKKAKKDLSVYNEKIREQFQTSRAMQQELENDATSKEAALGIDYMCHQLNNHSKGINYYGGIEKYDPSVTNQKIWSENSNRMILKSQAERVRTQQMIKDMEKVNNDLMTQIWDVWSATNDALSKRVAEIIEAKSLLQMHLQKLQREIMEIEEYIENIKKTIIEKSPLLKVAHTRLEARTHRVGVELCKDFACDSLVKEVVTLQNGMNDLHTKLQIVEAQHQELLKTRAKLESDLHGKVQCLYIDREKCMGMRRTFPLVSTVKY